MSMLLLLAVPQGATQLSFTTQPQAVNAGATMSAVVVKALRDDGSVDPAFRATITVALTSAGGATLGGDVTVAAVAGVATFSDLVVTGETGSRTLTATATGLTSATSDSFTVSVLDPATLDNLALYFDAREGVTGAAGSFTLGNNAQANGGDTLAIAGVALVAGTDWTASSDNTTQATNIKDAINAAGGLSGVVTATSSGGTVTVTRAVSTLDTGIAVTYVGTGVIIGGNQYDATDGKCYTAVSQWDDARGAGSGSLTQATGSARPRYVGGANPGIRFDAGDSLVGTVGAVTALPMAAWGVSKFVNDAQEKTVFSMMDGDAAQTDGWFMAGSSGEAPVTGTTGAGTARATSSVSVSTNLSLIESRWLSATDRRVRGNGANEATDTTSKTPSGVDRYAVGVNCRGAGNVNFMNGDVRAVVVLSADRTVSQANAVGQFAVLTHGVPSVALVAA